MDYFEATKRLKKGEGAKAYFIGGQETHLALKLEKQIIEAACGQERDALQVLSSDAGIDEIVNAVESVPFFSERNVVVVRDSGFLKDKKSMASEKEAKFYRLLENIPSYSVLVLTLTDKLDKRKKIYKTMERFGWVIEVNPLKARDLRDWLQMKLVEIDKRFDKEAYAYFLEVTSMMSQISVGFLNQEMEKLALYTDRKMVQKEDLQAVFASLPEVSVFSLLDAVSDKDVKLALRLLSEQLQSGVHPLRLHVMLTRHVRQLWRMKRLLKSGCTGRQAAEKLGVAPFVGEKLAAKSKNFSESVLQMVFLDLAEADYKFKSGQADCALLERILISWCA